MFNMSLCPSCNTYLKKDNEKFVIPILYKDYRTFICNDCISITSKKINFILPKNKSSIHGDEVFGDFIVTLFNFLNKH